VVQADLIEEAALTTAGVPEAKEAVHSTTEEDVDDVSIMIL